MLRGILLDIDGTLLLSNDAHARAWVDAYHEFGYDIPFERIQPLIGMGGDKLMKQVTPDLDEESEPGKDITTRRREIFLGQYVSGLQPAPGARALVQRLRDLELQLTVATSAKGEELQPLLEAARIVDLVGEKTTSDDAEASKPDPDIVQAALQKSRLPATDVLMLGDTPYDVESAGKAGVGVVAFRCGGHGDDLHGALAVYDDPQDLLEHWPDAPIAARLGPPGPVPKAGD